MYNATKEDTIANLKNASQNVRNVAVEAGEEVKQDLRETAGKAGRKVRAFLHAAEDEVTSACDSVTSQIRTKPVQSSLIALAAGLVVGALLRRRSS